MTITVADNPLEASMPCNCPTSYTVQRTATHRGRSLHYMRCTGCGLCAGWRLVRLDGVELCGDEALGAFLAWVAIPRPKTCLVRKPRARLIRACLTPPEA